MSLTNLWRGPKSNRHLFAKMMLVGLLASLAIPLVHPSSAQAANTISATWKTTTTILSSGLANGEYITYTQAPNGKLPSGSTTYQLFSDNLTCPSYIYFGAKANLKKTTSAHYYQQQEIPGIGGCQEVGTGTVTLTNTQTNPDSTLNTDNSGSKDTTGGGSGSDMTNVAASAGTSGGSTVEDNPDACDTSIKNPLTWVLCPVVDIMHKAADFMQSAIVHLMTVDVKGTFDQSTDSGAAYYTAWNSFRILGIVLIIIAGLIMVISQALGFEIFDAYTVKRVLPRLLVAVIGISLSWWLLKFLVELTNDLGIGIRRLILLPFQSLAGGQNGIQSLGSSLIGDLGIGAAFLFLGIGGLVTLLGTVLLAALIAFVVLILRQIIITFLILIAPLAIACYVLPNTEKAYKLWWDSLFKGLMMFPIISAFLAAGAVFSVVASHNTSADFDLSKIISILAYFLPYFAIPFTFRLAGGAIATLGGLTNDRSRGMFDALKNKRKAIMSDRFQRAQSQSLWDNNSKVGKQANKVASWVTDPVSNTQYYGRNIPGLRKSGHRVAGQIEHARMEQSGKLFEELNKMGYNDKAYRAIAGAYKTGEFSNEVLEKMDSAGFVKLQRDAQGNIVQENKNGKMRHVVAGAGKTRPHSLKDIQTLGNIFSTTAGASETERIAGNAILGSSGRLATLYQDGEMTKTSTEAAGILGLAAHGFADGEDIAMVGNHLSEGKQEEAGFAQSVMSQAQLYGMRSRPDVKPGYGVVSITEKDPDGKVKIKFVDGMSEEGGRAAALLDTLQADDLASAKGGAIAKLKPTIKAVLDAGGPKAQAQKDQLFQWVSPYSRASVDVKAQALQMIKDFGLQEDYEKTLRSQASIEEIEAMRRAGIDPEQQQGGGPGAGGPGQ